MIKNRLIQTLLVVLFALCTLFSGFISVLACIPVSTDVEIRETVVASASAISAGADSAYLVEVRGALKNTTGETLVVERLEIPVYADGRGNERATVVIENISISPRNTVTVSKVIETATVCENVGEIVATVGGEEILLRNPAQTNLTVSLIPIAVTAVFVYLLVRACKVRYYMYIEDRADAGEG